MGALHGCLTIVITGTQVHNVGSLYSQCTAALLVCATQCTHRDPPTLKNDLSHALLCIHTGAQVWQFLVRMWATVTRSPELVTSWYRSSAQMAAGPSPTSPPKPRSAPALCSLAAMTAMCPQGRAPPKPSCYTNLTGKSRVLPHEDRSNQAVPWTVVCVIRSILLHRSFTVDCAETKPDSENSSCCCATATVECCLCFDPHLLLSAQILPMYLLLSCITAMRHLSSCTTLDMNHLPVRGQPGN